MTFDMTEIVNETLNDPNSLPAWRWNEVIDYSRRKGWNKTAEKLERLFEETKHQLY